MPLGAVPEEAYWNAFYRVLGRETGAILRALLLSLYPQVGGSAAEVDRVRHGLRQIMGERAEVVERVALGRPSPQGSP